MRMAGKIKEMSLVKQILQQHKQGYGNKQLPVTSPLAKILLRVTLQNTGVPN